MRSILLLLLTLTSSPAIAIVVDGEGVSLIDAQDHARRQAITQLVGAIVDTERVVANRKLVVDQILTYSAGYIVKEVILEHYIIPHYDTPGERHFVKLDVEVKSSKLKDFVLSKTEGTSKFDANNIKLQIESYNKQLIDADILIDNTLKYHLSHAYTIDIVDYSISTDANRKAYMTITYQQSWNREFIDAIEEIAKLIDVPQFTVSYLKFDDRKYQIDDHIHMNKFRNVFSGEKTVMTINSMRNDSLINRCVEFDVNQRKLRSLYWVRNNGASDIEFNRNKTLTQQVRIEIKLEEIALFQDNSLINIRLVQTCPKYKRK
jgi:hypothetical protein